MFFMLFPAAALAAIFLYLSHRSPAADHRRHLLRAGVVFATYLVLTLEVLSLVNAITRPGLILAWCAPPAAFAFWYVRLRRRGERLQWPRIRLPDPGGERALMLGVVGVVLLTALVAWLTPPQTWDSLTYHLSRVAHWAQNRSLRHFSTGIARQVSMSPGAEMITLNAYVLTGGDRLASFTQWFSMFFSLAGVSLLARQLGADRTGQWLAALFAATLPIGIVESSSTITDYVVTLWLVCVAVESVAYSQSDDRASLLYAGFATALAVLTKPISVPFIAVFAVWISLPLIRRRGIRGAIQWGIVALLAIGFVNSGYLSRNLKTYGQLSNPVDFRVHVNQLVTFPGVASNLIRHAGMHAGVMYLGKLNAAWNGWIQKAHETLGVSLEDPRTTAIGTFRVQSPSTQEDITSNPIHAYTIAGTILLSVFFHKRIQWPTILYTFAIMGSFILYSALFKWQVFAGRFHLPYFVLFAPPVGSLLSVLNRWKIGYLAAAVFLVGAYPWLLSINSRPLVPREGRSTVGSILAESRHSLYFANALTLQEDYGQLTSAIRDAGCSTIGLMLHGDDPEYLLWVLMGAPDDSLQIEWIVSGPTARYEPDDFQPCAVICSSCPQEWESVRGLAPTAQVGDLQLFADAVR